MKQRYAHFLLTAFGIFIVQFALAQPPCNSNFTTPAGQTAITTGSPWGPASVPPTMSGAVNTTTNAGSTTASVTVVTGLSVGNTVTGPNIPAGTTITGIGVPTATSITLSQPATGTGTNVPHTYTVPGWPNNYPPTTNLAPTINGTIAQNPGSSVCSVCPATYSVPICAGQFVNMYLCAGNLYTFSMCSSASTWNSTITVTNISGVPQNFQPNWDDDGCGTTNGHAVVTFTPQSSQQFRIRVFNDPCVVNGALCGTLQISCNPFPPPPPNDDPAGAITLSPGGITSTTCNPLFTSAAYGTLTVAGAPPLPSAAGCGTGGACTGATPGLTTGDVWYTAVMPASGRLAIEVDQISAGNLAMAVYSAPGPGGPFTPLACGCNVDIVTGVPDPYVNVNNAALAGQTVYIRVWPEGGFGNNGTFTICAFEPIPPVNDQPCGAINIPVAPAACSPQTYSTQNATALTGVTLSPATPACGSPITGGDVWFTVTMPSTGSLTVNTGSGTLSNMAMQAYQPGPCGGPLTEVAGACSDNQNTVSVALTTTAGSATATVASTAGLNAGDGISGLNVPVNTTIAAVVNATTVTLSQPAINGVVLGSTSGGSNVLTLASTVGIVVGSAVTGAGIPAGTTVTAVTPTTITLSLAATGTNLNSPYSFSSAAHTIGNLMPRITLTGAPGQVFYIRAWNQNILQGTFQICAFQNNPPPNDNPCSPVGATALAVQPGCLFGPFQTNDLASNTPPNILGQHASIAAPTCGGTPVNDVWYTAVVPSNGVLQFDTDDGQMTNAAMAIYTATGSCAAGNLALSQVPGGCFAAGSSNGAGMPAGQVTGLAPGSVVYVRLWREGGSDGTFQICARTTVPPPGNCTYTLRMFDSAGDGWNGSFVTVCVGASCTNYTVNGSNGTITIGANFGQIITVTYTAAGGFQNQISYQLLSNTGGLIYGSTNPPTQGSNTAFVVDALCNVPPAPPSDCVGATPVCDNQSFGGSPTNIGGVNDLSATNRGCLVSNERQGFWYRFQAQVAGQLAFTIAPAAVNDYDFAVWGPFSGAVSCPPPSPPLRCSYAAGGGPTGLNFSSVDLSEGAGGDRFVRFIDVLPGQWYLLYVDNFAQSGVNFTLSWSNTPNNLLDCTIVLPVELLTLDAQPADDHVVLNWSTASEQDASHFVVERSADGDRFEPIGQVAAAGTTMVTSSYRFIDQRPVNGTNFYRLRTVDIDGKTGYTQVVTAEFRQGSIPLQLFPNPANETINASFVLDGEGAVRWRVLDMSGRLVQEALVPGTAGANRVEIPLARVDAGSYLFEVVDEAGVLLGNSRFVKQ
jgi:hypothetical protein